jgi:L-threonylcarbamoyladenylate synthase
MVEKIPITNTLQIITNLQQGAVIAFPTDTVWGVGCASSNDEAITKLYTLKDRPLNQPTALLISEVEDLFPFCDKVSDHLVPIMDKFWPGALTLILQVKKEFWKAPFCSGNRTIGFRLPDYALLVCLIKQLGSPLVASSANLRGQQPKRDVKGVENVFSKHIDGILMDENHTLSQKASTVLDATTFPCTIVREGAIPRSDLEKYL